MEKMARRKSVARLSVNSPVTPPTDRTDPTPVKETTSATSPTSTTARKLGPVDYKRRQSQKRLFPAVLGSTSNGRKHSPSRIGTGGSFSLTGSSEELSGIMDKVS